MGLCRKLKDLRKNIDGLSLKATLMYVKSLPGYTPQTGDSTGFGVTVYVYIIFSLISVLLIESGV